MVDRSACLPWRVLWQAARPAFLWLTLVVMGLTLMVVGQSETSAHWILWGLAFLLALAAHVSVNWLNEYEDARSGLDALTVETPYSGGSGALQRCPQYLGLVQRAGWFLVACIALIGLLLVLFYQVALLGFGLLGLSLVVFYTTHLTRRPWLMWLAPGLAFGPLMMLGTQWLLIGHGSATLFWLAMMVFFLVNNLLLLNQFPDVAADARVGRVSLPMWLGTQASRHVFVVSLVCVYVSLAMALHQGRLPESAMLGWITLLLAVPLAWRVWRDHQNLTRLKPVLGWNVAVALLTPGLVAAGIWIGEKS